jgi:predicted nucleic acid-binding protein
VIVVDSSVAIAAALPWHEHHTTAIAALPSVRTALIAAVAMETYSVLTRLPPPQRLLPGLAFEYLQERFQFPPLALASTSYESLLALAAAERIDGGTIYDAVIAATAKESEATLLTLDRRAAPTYEIVGVTYRVIW